MKQGIYELSIVVALTAFVGCSSATPSAPPISSTGALTNSYIDARKKKVIETLKASRVVVKVTSCVSGAGGATFSAKGKAKGRVRGKFVVSGAWNVFSASGQTFWTFGETFKIKGKHPITGTIEGSGTDAIATCKTFGPVSKGADLTYHLGTLSGAATTSLIKNGAKFLQQMR